MALKEAIGYIPAGRGAIDTTLLLYGLGLSDGTVDTDWLVTANSFTLGTLGAAVDYAVKIQGTVTPSGTGLQDVAILAGPVTATGVVLGDAPFVLSAFTTLTNGQVVIGRTGLPPVAATLTGTANQIVITNGAGTITFSLPQAIAAASTPTFGSGTLTATTNQITLGTTNVTTISSVAPAASRTVTLPDAGAASTFVTQIAPTAVSTDIALTKPGGQQGTVFLTKAGIGALTLAAPTSGTDDGKVMRITSTTANAHVVTSSVDGFNAKGSSGTLTFGGAIGDSCVLVAYLGHWYVQSARNVTAA